MSKHVNYPHEPGRLYDCPACEARCHCTPGTAECIYTGVHTVKPTDTEVVDIIARWVHLGGDLGSDFIGDVCNLIAQIGRTPPPRRMQYSGVRRTIAPHDETPLCATLGCQEVTGQ